MLRDALYVLVEQTLHPPLAVPIPVIVPEKPGSHLQSEASSLASGDHALSGHEMHGTPSDATTPLN
jgi:hypothetical protein